MGSRSWSIGSSRSGSRSWSRGRGKSGFRSGSWSSFMVRSYMSDSGFGSVSWSGSV